MTQLDIVRLQADRLKAAPLISKGEAIDKLTDSLMAFLTDLDNRVAALERPHDASRGRLKTWGGAGGRPL